MRRWHPHSLRGWERYLVLSAKCDCGIVGVANIVDAGLSAPQRGVEVFRRWQTARAAVEFEHV